MPARLPLVRRGIGAGFPAASGLFRAAAGFSPCRSARTARRSVRAPCAGAPVEPGGTWDQPVVEMGRLARVSQTASSRAASSGVEA